MELGLQPVTVNVIGSIPTRRNLIFAIRLSGAGKAQRWGQPLNPQRLQNSVEVPSAYLHLK